MHLSRINIAALSTALLLSTGYATEKKPAAPEQHASAAPILDARHDGHAAAQAIAAQYGTLPLAFEENRGQADAAVKFLSRGMGYQVFLTGREAVMVFEGATARQEPGERDGRPHTERGAAVVRMRFERSNKVPTVNGIGPLAFKSNYFVGNDTTQHVTAVPNYARVKYTSIYRGIDLLYYGNRQRLEYDLVVAPRAKPQQIRMSFAGADKLSLSDQGHLTLSTAAGEVTFQKPLAYQDIKGRRKPVEAQYLLADNGHAGFRLGKYDTRKPLVIDPVVSYSSYLWGVANGVALDAAGNVYIVGSTSGTDLPAATGYQTKLAGYSDAYVLKLNPAGSSVLYATYLGARRSGSYGNSIAVDAAGNAYVAGIPGSSSFPVTSGAYQTAYTTPASFVTKLNPNGNGLVYSTLVTGATVAAVALDASGSLYMTGTASALTTTAGAFQSTPPAASSPFVAKLNPTGSAMNYATYVGGNGGDQGKSIAVDASGHAYVAGIASSTNFPTANPYQAARLGGKDAFVAKLDPSGTSLVYSTYLGGTDDEAGNAITVNAAGEAFIAGQTFSADFPVTLNAFQRLKGYSGDPVSNGFITKLSASGSALAYSSFLGGTWCYTCWSASIDNDTALAVAVDSVGYAYVGGRARSAAFRLADPVQDTVPVNDGQGAWPFMAKVTPQGDRLVYSILLGENTGYDRLVSGIAADSDGNAYGVGQAYGIASTTYPTTAGALLTTGSDDINSAFILKISTSNYPPAVRSSANPVVAGQTITLTADVYSTKPNGSITFMDGAAMLGAASVLNGRASITTSLSPGVHPITAVFSLDGKVSSPLFQVVNSK